MSSATANTPSIDGWLSELPGAGTVAMEGVGVVHFVALLGVSLVSASLVSALYLTFYRERATGSQVHRAFPLLGVSITAIFICIQFSLPLSLGLLGALSIVRFRTPIKEPEEIGFILLVIATSICCATFNLVFLAALLAVAVAGLTIAHAGTRLRHRRRGGLLTVTLDSGDAREQESEILALLRNRLPQGELDGIVESDAQSTISFVFPPVDPESLIRVQKEVRAISGSARSNLFVHRSGSAT